MLNPWNTLPTVPPYLLPSDTEIVQNYNARKYRANFYIHDELLPEPYMGHPDAPVFLLNLNPSFSEDDAPFYQNPYVQQVWRKNILHEAMEFPFYLIDPQLQTQRGGTQWWNARLRELIEATSRKHVAQNVCCVEFFPYHARNYKNFRVPSQQYSFHLVKQAMERRVCIIRMRSEKLWVSAVPELLQYPYFYRTNSVQSAYVSYNNLPPSVFNKIVESILKRNTDG